jgi:hypothetical protein
MGMGATNTLGRVLSSLGGQGPVVPEFESCLDVPNGGVLFGLPALISVGILRHTEKHFQLPNGFYGLPTIFLLLAFMALARQKFIENLRYVAPGEWGKLLGLDRAPEPKILREKVTYLSHKGSPKLWSAELCTDWMNEFPKEASTLYIDGHVRVYHGSQTKLPRHYISRDKLCARAVCDYWVNAMHGMPYFMVTKPIDPGLIKTLEQDIIPKLEKDIPNQPTMEELKADPLLMRFSCVFDREGYSTESMYTLWVEKRIACITYSKHQSEDWPHEEFESRKIKLASGEEVDCKIAERSVFKILKCPQQFPEETVEVEILDSHYKKDKVTNPKLCYVYMKMDNGRIKKVKGFWFREIRKLKENGQQGSITTTDYINNLDIVVVKLVSRWSQENFFAYMAKHYGLNSLIDYKLEEIDDTIKVVNPNHRQLASEIKKLAGILGKMKKKFATISLDGEIGEKEFNENQIEKSKILEEMNRTTKLITDKKEEQKAIPKHILISELPDDLKFKALSSNSKHFIDTIKMIAYRSETATVNILKESMSDYAKDEARSLMKAIYQSPIDIIVDKEKSTLTIKLHNLANHCSDKSVEYLCEELNESEIVYPGTNLKLVYQLLTSKPGTIKNGILPSETGCGIKSSSFPTEKHDIGEKDSVEGSMERVQDAVGDQQILFGFMED